ncbi:cell surface glycoprotein [Streptomyces sp. NBC_01142]|uniref:zinc finger domain-containing protein n=1 Tax=Streptomyces sp. NBC_01142 TaxID=2975865 RepID=UPI00224E2B80|nr:cell surface glycoprotein [Streptomyces sp. NBC_01142]MCX4824223.1 cell surface glycoprotein [Streptomyces sp. NBC_01142]
MTREEVAALLAYAVSLDPRLAPADQAEADERLAQWFNLLEDVPPTAPHPDGRHWHAGHIVRHHIASSPYRLQPSDVSRPWHTFKADVLGRHTDPVPPVDPDDHKAYRAALAGTRTAIAAGQAAASVYRELTGGSTREERNEFAAARLRALGDYMPRTVAAELKEFRKTRAEREHRAAAGLPDPLDVTCPYVTCRARPGTPCQQGGKRRTDRSTPHPSRLDLAAEAEARDRAEAQRRPTEQSERELDALARMMARPPVAREQCGRREARHVTGAQR